jgi:hypothetical protein
MRCVRPILQTSLTRVQFIRQCWAFQARWAFQAFPFNIAARKYAKRLKRCGKDKMAEDRQT